MASGSEGPANELRRRTKERETLATGMDLIVGVWLPIHLFGGAPGYFLVYFLLHGPGGLWLGATTLSI